jgi:autoinducer 2-binding protein LuxP
MGKSGSCILALIAMVFANGAEASNVGPGEYITIDQLHVADPDEAEKAARFAARVSEPAELFPDPGMVRISVVYPGDQVSDYWRRSISSMTRRLDESGLRYEIEKTFTRPGSEINRQASVLMRALERDPDYLVFTLDAKEHATFIEQIIARGSTRLILQNITTPVRSWRSRQPFLYVGFDHSRGSRLLAERYVRMTGGISSYAILFGTRGYVSSMRGEGFTEVMNEHPGMGIVDAFYVGFDRDAARIAAKELLDSYPDLDFIFCVSTDIALGAIDALKETGKLGQVKVNGWGGGEAEIEALRRGDLDLTVMRINDDNGVAMADAISLVQAGRADEVPLVFSGEMVLIDSNTTDDILSELSNRAFRYSDRP